MERIIPVRGVIMCVVVVLSLGTLGLTASATPTPTPKPSPWFAGAAMYITQNAMSQAPDQYANVVVEMMQKLNAEKWPDAHDDGHGCHVEWSVTGSQAKKKITLVPNTLKATIVAGGVVMDGRIHVVASMPAFLRPCKKKWFICWCHTFCNGEVTITTDIDVSMLFNATWNSKTGTISITTKPTVSYPAQPNIQGCSHPSGILSWFISWKEIVNDIATQAAQAAVADLTTQFNVPQVFSPYANVFVTYKATNLAIAPANHILVPADMMLEAQVMRHGKWVNLTYIDPSPPDAALAPPTSWNATAIGPDKTTIYLLTGLRVSSTMLSAMMWAGDITGAFMYDYETTVLDAHLQFGMGWSPPQMIVPKNDQMNFTIANGYINATCATVGKGFGKLILDFFFYNLKGAGDVNITHNSSGDPGFYPQVLSFDLNVINMTLKAPPIPLPTTVIDEVMKDMITDFTPELNEYLTTHPMMLPEKIAKYMPNPTIELFNEPGCCNGYHGYMELNTFCKCNDPNPNLHWVECKFKCANSHPSASTFHRYRAHADTALSFVTSSVQSAMQQWSISDRMANNQLSLAPLPEYVNKMARKMEYEDEQDMAVSLSSLDSAPGDGVYLSVYDNIGSEETVNTFCSLSQIGDSMIMIFLPTTDGKCVRVDPQIHEEQNVTLYYSLVTDGHGKFVSGAFMCFDPKCSQGCALPGATSTVSDVCYSTKEVSLSLAIQGGTPEARESKDACIGAAKAIPSLSNLVSEYQQSDMCSFNNTVSTPTVVMNLTNIYPPQAESCELVGDPDENSPNNKYCSVSRVNKTTHLYDVNAWCSSTCTGCRFYMNNVQNDQCVASGNLTSRVLNHGSDFKVCSSLMPPPIPAPFVPNVPIPPINPAWIYGSVALVVVLLTVFIYRNQRAHAACDGFAHLLGIALTGAFVASKDLLVETWNKSVRWVKESIGLARGRNAMSNLERKQVFRMFLVALAFGSLVVMWHIKNPFDIFENSITEDLGIPISASHSSHVKANSTMVEDLSINDFFRPWGHAGRIVAWCCAVIVLVVCVCRLFFVRPNTDVNWRHARLVAIAAALGAQFILFVVPPLFYALKDSIVIKVGPGQNFILSSPKVRHVLDEVLGWGFTGISLTYLSNLFVFLTWGMPAGVYMATVFFIAKDLPEDWPSLAQRSSVLRRARFVICLTHVVGPIACIAVSPIVATRILGAYIAPFEHKV